MLKIEVITVSRVDFTGLQAKVNSFLSKLPADDVVDITYKTFDIKFLAIITYKE